MPSQSTPKEPSASVNSAASAAASQPASHDSSAPIDCIIFLQPLRYGIKFEDDPNWYEVYAAWEWLKQKDTSPATRKPWCAIAETKDFTFDGCISNYNHQKLIEDIRKKLRKNPDELAAVYNPLSNQVATTSVERRIQPPLENINIDFIVLENDLPNQADRARVEGRMNQILRFAGEALLHGVVRYAAVIENDHGTHEFLRKAIGNDVEAAAVGVTVHALHYAGNAWLSSHPVAANRLRDIGANLQRFFSPLAQGIVEQQQEAHFGGLSYRAEGRRYPEQIVIINEEPQNNIAREEPPRQQGCWSCVRRAGRATYQFFKKAAIEVMPSEQALFGYAENQFRRRRN